MLVRIAAAFLAVATTAAAQEYDVPQWQGSYLPPSPTVVVEESPQDRMMALHAIALALTEQEEVRWTNSTTGNRGYATVAPYGGGCVTLTNHTIIQERPVQAEAMRACRGGGNANTWIINNQWHINSVDRYIGGNCRTRYMDTRLQRGRVYSVQPVCRMDDGVWNVEENS